MDYEILGGAAAVPVILALVEVVKRAWPQFDGDRFSALLAVVLGVAIAGGYQAAEGGNIAEGVLVGVLLGLSASGLYSGTASAKRIQTAERFYVPEDAVDAD